MEGPAVSFRRLPFQGFERLNSTRARSFLRPRSTVALSLSLAARKASVSGLIVEFGHAIRQEIADLGRWGDDGRPAIGFIPAADDHSASLQPVDNAGDRAVGQADPGTELLQAQTL